MPVNRVVEVEVDRRLDVTSPSAGSLELTLGALFL